MRIVPGPVSGGHRSPPHRPAFSPDGERFVAGDLQGGLIVHARAGGILAQTQAPSRIHAVAWSPDGSRIAAAEDGGVRLRRPADLSVEADLKSPGKRGIAFGGGGRRLAVLGDASVRLTGVPGAENLGLHLLGPRGDYEYFHARTLATDPDGDLIAAGDDGGRNETAMGAVLGSGVPQVTLLPSTLAIETGAIARQIEFDRRRGVLWVSTYGDVAVWSTAGTLVRRFKPYPRTYVLTMAMAEPWIATVPNVPPYSLDFWHPETLAPLASVAVPNYCPGWLTASPDGRTLLLPGVAAKDDFGVRIWSVE